ncbi:MAG TPA: hypothetical protein VEF76_03315 [Patescibacteria group bacterium]|nr:hypothetical protein [Patescibacteria group bacterium]
MKALVDGFITSVFNAKVEYDLRALNLTQDMLQAFYRREFNTVSHLASQGARFTPEMLQVAVGFRDQNLARICLDHHVMPNEAMVKFAIDCRDQPLALMLMEKIPAHVQDLRRYATRRDDHAPIADEHII